MAIRLGCSSGAFFPHIATEEVPALAAALGIFDIELMLQAHEEYELPFFADVRSRAEAHGVAIRSVHFMQPFHPLFSTYRRRAAEAWRLFEKGIEGAALAGAEMIVWHGPCQGEVQEHDALDCLLTAARELASQCTAAGLTLTIENVSWCYLSSVRAVRALASRIDEIGPPSTVGFTFDAFQAAESDANPFMMLAAMNGLLANVHLRDFRESDRTQRSLPPGDGDLPWPALLRAVAGTGFNGPLMIEGALGPDPEATMARIRAKIEPIIEGLAISSNPCDGELPSGVLEGIRLFNEGAYYECHEEIEHEWHAERGPIRALYQGILQIGVGFHHARNGNHRGAILLLTDGIEKTSRFLPACRGVHTERLVRESQRCLGQIADLGPERLSAFDWSLVPQVYFLEVPASVAKDRR
jgi:uncharacterized protein